MLLNLRNPIPNALEASAIGHVVHQEDALCSPKVAGGDGSKPFLPRGIPDLKLDAFAVDFDVFDFEVDADGGDEGGGEGVVGVAEEEAGFTDAGIADHEQFALHVVGGWLAHGLGGVVGG